ncbi:MULTISPECIES: tRNA (uridine(54)-C5)-methyltransferase TrmA [Halomonas]|uniref:tRNA/tmRNA (uracil-C(5))-methyltransferase n=2 Tax=Halomonas TaxID=2745 RepID=A0ABQ0U2T3_9GAMM|nr:MULTISPECIES: tRNA (uridine(54)-C5)-methyltransferase TrmA [Halomonas]KGE78342.1 tRNA (uracil-5-)-methyltransferase [Halomonas salina]MDR5887993.1 tRNA (uridine(54)-C5)-methyltransferase TrmA [Halomonas salina]WJY08519.1 tRNA (uridine(54)-C5)-methyltransferase TrmA [Halomonas halophila]GEK72486.1 tRNA/tmRNA (uracil-C(5))-methyltransferase [Halomonas halophila]
MAIPVVDPDRYDEQLAAKRDRLTAQFARFAPPELEVHASPASHYRQRCEFRVWHEGDDLYYAMFEVDPEDPKQKTVVRLDDYPVAGQRINELMPALRERLLDNPTLRHRLFQVEFLTTLTGEALVTLIYHRQLDEAWEVEARALEQALDIMIIGRARKQRLVLTRDHVWERLGVDGRELVYQQVENSFTQPNAEICRSMLSWARDVTAGSTERDLVELYCGNGNFTVALAENFRRVLATEISRTSVASARENLAANGVDNAVVGRMSAEEFSQALRGEKGGRRVAEFGLDDYDFSTVLVDPPRAGLDEDSCRQLSDYERIVYISCNPDTLADNLETLTRTHEVVRFALFDQFPWTHHCECGVLLERRR